MSPKSPRIDAHCHFFNISYLVDEIAQILWEKLWGHYPHPSQAVGALERVSLSSVDKWFDDFLVWLSQLTFAFFNSYEGNLSCLTAAYQQSFNTVEKLITCPLMMDIHYMYAAPCSPASGVSPPKAKGPFVEDPRKEFKKRYNQLCETVVKRWKDTVPGLSDTTRLSAALLELSDVQQILDDTYKKTTALPPTRGLKASLSKGVELSIGFANQIREMMRLQKNCPDTVFPFLAVDPRRIGIMDLIKKGGPFLRKEGFLVSKNGPFYGIKFYPRLGYKPTDVDTQCKGLFDWCQTNDIPITFHGSKTGFPEFPKNWAYGDFGNPVHWQAVLNQYKTLRINFAHFGNNGDGWPQRIIKLMNDNKYKNIFTDLACYTDPVKLQKVLDMFVANPILKDRLMFGTDFDVMLTTGIVPLKKYFDQFNNIFSPGEMDRMSRNVPYSFLNRKQPAIAREAKIRDSLPRK